MRILTVCGGKGGVGKTTVVSNLAASLADLGRNVVAVDANITTPNLGLHLGIPLYPVTLHDVLRGSVRMRDALYNHPSGFKVVPAGISLDDLRGVDVNSLHLAIMGLLGSADIVLIDCAAGLGREAVAAIESSDELLLVTNPEMPALTDALKTIKVANRVGTKIAGVVLNRVRNEPHELSSEKVEELLSVPVVGVVPDDINVQRSIAAKKPVVHYKPHSSATHAFRGVAAKLVGEHYRVPFSQTTLAGRLFGFIFGR